MIKIDMDTLNTWGNECLKSTAFSEKEDTKIVLRATRDTTAARHLFGIQRIGLAMADSINPPFEWRLLENGKVAIFKDSLGDLVFGLLIHLEREEFAESFPLHEMNPVCGHLLEMIEARQLVDKIRSPQWHLDCDAKRSLVADLNSFVHDYREELGSEAFNRRMNHYLARSTEIEHGLLSMIDDAFQRAPQVMAIRMDLGYRPTESLPDGQDSVYLEDASAHRDVLLTALRNVFEDSLVACAWKLEHCREKGFGYHVLFLFDGCKVSDDVATCEVIGDAWDVAATKGAGAHLSYNAYRAISKAYCLGPISRRSTKAIRSFKERIVTSMAKTDFCMQIRPAKAAQTFGMVRHEPAGKDRRYDLTS